MDITIKLEGSQIIIEKIIDLLNAIPSIKTQVQTKTAKSNFIPDEITKKAIEDAKTGNGCKFYRTSSEMFKSLGINV